MSLIMRKVTISVTMHGRDNVMTSQIMNTNTYIVQLIMITLTIVIDDTTSLRSKRREWMHITMQSKGK